MIRNYFCFEGELRCLREAAKSGYGGASADSMLANSLANRVADL
jgi:hypothetical protein